MHLKNALAKIFRDRTLVVGIGNRDCADDGFGPQMIELLEKIGWPDLFDAGTTPENIPAMNPETIYENVLLLDVVEIGTAVGTMFLMDAEEIKSRFPQVSTHKISLGIIASMIKERMNANVWLLGAQPCDISLGKPMTDDFSISLEILLEIFKKIKTREAIKLK